MRRRRLRLLAGWCSLMLYALAFTPLGVGLAAVTGSLDRNHDALLQSDAHGVNLVLHHRNRCAAHHHGLLARTLTLFAESPRSGSPDHVLQFGSVDNISCPKQVTTPPKAGAALAHGISPASILCRLPQPVAPFVPSRIPAENSGTLLGVRSTVLLI